MSIKKLLNLNIRFITISFFIITFSISIKATKENPPISIENNAEKRLNEIESYVKEEELKETNLENKSIYEIINPIENLINEKENLIKFENEKIDDKLKKKINDLKNSISILLIKYFENYIPILKKEDLENMSAIPFEINIYILYNYKEILTKIKEELNDSKITNIIDNLINNSKNDISNFLIKIIEIYLKKLKKENFKNLFEPLIVWNKHHINYLKNCKKILMDIKKETSNKETANKIDELIIKLKEDIPSLIIKLEEGNTKKEDLKTKTENKIENNINKNEIKINPEKQNTQPTLENKIKDIETTLNEIENNIKTEKEKNNLNMYIIHKYINNLPTLKHSLEYVKKEDSKGKFENIIDKLIDKIINLQISLIEETTNKIEQEHKNIQINTLYITKEHINNLSTLKNTLEDIKKEDSKGKFENIIDKLIDKIINLQIDLIKGTIYRIKQESESINSKKIEVNINNLSTLKNTLEDIKKEDNEGKFENIITNLTENIENLLINIFEKNKTAIQQTIEQILKENNKLTNNQDNYYNFMKYEKYVEILTNLEQKTENENTKKILNNLLNNIYFSEAKLIENEINNIEENIKQNKHSYSHNYLIEKIEKYQEMVKNLSNIKINSHIEKEIEELKFYINELKFKIFNKTINLIENIITNLEKKNFEYFDIKYSIIPYIEKLENFEKETNDFNIKNKIIELKNKIYKIVINKIEYKIDVIVNKLEIKNNIKTLKQFKYFLTEINQKITDNEIKDKVDELIYTISSLLINLFDYKVTNLQLNLSDTILNNIEQKDFKKMPIWKIRGYIKYLQNYKNNKKQTSRSKSPNKRLEKIDLIITNLENIIKQISEKINDETNKKINEIESYVKKLKTTNPEKIENNEAKKHIKKIKDLETTIIELEEKAKNDEKVIEKIKNLKNEIFKIEINLNEKHITELEKKYSEKADNINYENIIENLNNYKLHLISIYSNLSENEIKNKFNDLTKKLETIINKIKNFQNDKEFFLLDFNNKYKEIESNINLLKNKTKDIFDVIFKFEEEENSKEQHPFFAINDTGKCNDIINDFYSRYDNLVKTLNLTKNFGYDRYLENKKKTEKLKEQFENIKNFYEEALNCLRCLNKKNGHKNNLYDIESELKKIDTMNFDNKLICELESIKNYLFSYKLNLEKMKQEPTDKLIINKITLLETKTNNLLRKVFNTEIAIIKNNLNRVNDQLHLNIFKNHISKIENEIKNTTFNKNETINMEVLIGLPEIKSKIEELKIKLKNKINEKNNLDNYLNEIENEINEIETLNFENIETNYNSIITKAENLNQHKLKLDELSQKKISNQNKEKIKTLKNNISILEKKLNDKINEKNNLDNYLNEIENEINKIEALNFDYKIDIKTKHNIEDYLVTINDYNKNLTYLEKKTNNFRKINKIKTKDLSLQVNLFEKYINILENFDFENIPNEEFGVTYLKKDLINLSKTNTIFKNQINDIVNKYIKIINKLNNIDKKNNIIKAIIINCKNKIEEFKNKNFKILDININNIKDYLKILNKYNKQLTNYIEKTEDSVIKTEIDNLLTEKIYETQINLIEKYISKLEKTIENDKLEFKNIKFFLNYIYECKECEKILSILKNNHFINYKEKINILINKVNNLNAKINNSLIKYFKIKQRSKSK